MCVTWVGCYVHTSVHMCDMGHPTDVAGGPTHVHTYVCAQVQQAAPSRDMCGVEHIRVLCNYVAQLCTQVCTMKHPTDVSHTYV